MSRQSSTSSDASTYYIKSSCELTQTDADVSLEAIVATAAKVKELEQKCIILYASVKKELEVPAYTMQILLQQLGKLKDHVWRQRDYPDINMSNTKDKIVKALVDCHGIVFKHKPGKASCEE